MSKFSKSKIIGITTVSLAAVSLLGVGFSSWVIAASDVSDNAEVSVEVGTVDDQLVELVVDKDGSDLNVGFEADSTLGTGELCISGDGTKAEDLAFSIKYSLKAKASNFAGGKAVTMSINFSGAIDKILTTGEKTGLSLATLAVDRSSSADWTYDADAKTATRMATTSAINTEEVKFNFSWGEAFNDDNPAKMSTAPSNKTLDDVVSDLQALKTAIGTNKITATISAIVAK